MSLLAHEGSDEEVGHPDTEGMKHENVLSKPSKKRASQRKQAWDEDDVGR